MNQKIRIDQIEKGFCRHGSLSESQLARIKTIWSTFLEVFPVSLEETIHNFRCDEDAEGEIAIWEGMADQYKLRCETRAARSNKVKRKIFSEVMTESFESDPIVVVQSLREIPMG